jgi:replicative DNA helicase
MGEKIIGQYLQDCFLYLIITDSEFARISRLSIPSNYFSSITSDIVRLCYNYYDQFGRAPVGEGWADFNGEIEHFVERFDEERKKLYFRYLEKLQEMAPPSKEYVLARINKFIRARSIEEALKQAAPLVERGEEEEVEQILMKALRRGVPEKETFLTIPDDGSDFLQEKDLKSEIISNLGVPLLDEKVGGLKRGQLICFFGPAKGAKSWACLNVANEALTLGHNVLYLTHELKASEVGQRLYQKVRSLSLEEIDSVVTKYWEDGVEKESLFSPKLLSDLNEQEEVTRLLTRSGGKMKIRKYPMGTCSLGEIERVLNYLEAFNNFIPDVLITDYVEIMKLPHSEEKHEAINETYIGLKSIADQRNILVVTASQITRAGYGKSHVSQAQLPAGDIRKLANIDLGISLCTNEAQVAQNLMNVYIEVNRSGPQGFGCIIYNVFKIGQFAQFCKPIQRETQIDRPE